MPPRLQTASAVALRNKERIARNVDTISEFEGRIQTVEASIYNPWLALNVEPSEEFTDSYLVVHTANSALEVPFRVILNFTHPYAVIKDLTIANSDNLDIDSTDTEIYNEISDQLLTKYGVNKLLFQDTSETFGDPEASPDHVSLLIKDYTNYRFITTSGRPQFRGSNAPFTKVCDWRLDYIHPTSENITGSNSSTVLSGSKDSQNANKYIVDDGLFYLTDGVIKNSTSERIRVGYPCNIKYILIEAIGDPDLARAVFSWGREGVVWDSIITQDPSYKSFNLRFDNEGINIEEIYSTDSDASDQEIINKVSSVNPTTLATSIPLKGLNGGLNLEERAPLSNIPKYFFAGMTFAINSDGTFDKTKILIPPGTIYNYWGSDWETIKDVHPYADVDQSVIGALNVIMDDAGSDKFVPHWLSYFANGRGVPINYLFLKKLEPSVPSGVDYATVSGATSTT